MSASPRPVARSIVVCECVALDQGRPPRVSLLRLVSVIRPKAGDAYPLLLPSLAVFAQLTECRDSGRLRMEIRHADTDAVAYRAPDQGVRASNQPLAVYGVLFQVRNCAFPAPGLYWVQLWYDDELLTQTPTTLRP